MKTPDELKLDNIKTIICSEEKVDPVRITLKSRDRKIVIARQLFMFFGYEVAGCKKLFISQYLGQKDHTSVVHGIQRINDLIDTEWKFRDRVNHLRKLVIESLKPRYSKELQYTWEIYKNVENNL